MPLGTHVDHYQQDTPSNQAKGWGGRPSPHSWTSDARPDVTKPSMPSIEIIIRALKF